MTRTRRPLTLLLCLATLIGAPVALAAPAVSTAGRFPVVPQVFTVDSGEHHTVMIAGDGTPWAVGRNQSGQLCNGTTAPATTYTQMVGLPAGRSAVQVRAGSLMSAVLDNTGTLYGCGAAGSVNLGNSLAVLPGLPAGHRVTDLAVGFAHIVALLDDGRVYGLGRGSEGQLSGNQDQPTFIEISGLSPLYRAVDVAAGGYVTLVLDDVGDIRGTGLNPNGQLGALPSPVTTLTKVGNQPAGVEVVQIAAGTGHSLMLGSNGYAYAQGSNSQGQLGNGTSGGFATRWGRVRGSTDIVWIDGGAANTVAITAAGTPLTTGANADGQQGIPTGDLDRATELTEFGTDYLDFPAARFVAVAAGGATVIARDAEGFLFGAGSNGYHQIRSYDTDNVESLRRMPQQVARSSGGARITGRRQVGQFLIADPGQWTPNANMSFQYHWKRDGAVIQQSSSAQYQLVAEDLGRILSVQVFSNLPSSNNSSSPPVSVPIPGANLTRPVITGTPRVGKVLRARPGTWNAPGFTFRYQWLRKGKPIPGATQQTYRVAKADRSRSVSVRVLAVRAGFPSVAAVSVSKRALRSR